MSEPRIISPLLDGFALGGSISCHSGVNCYPAMRMDSDERYIVKTISIPASQTQLEALLLTGAYPDVEAARGYFKELTQGIRTEVEILDKLAAQRGFLPFLGYQVAPMEDGVGFEFYLISHYRRSLQRQLKREPLTHLAAVNMGIDLCAALAICREAGYLYVDLKPSNIYLSGSQEFHIGDLGFVALDSVKYASLPDRCRSGYTPPEVADAFSTLNTTMDTYALGLVLYQVYNNGQLPFDSEESRLALMERMANGEMLPPPMYADYEMGQIIAKACAYDPAERWTDPNEMGHALIAYMQRNGANDIPIGPVVIPEPEEIPEEEPIEEEAVTEETPLEEETEAAVEESEDLPEETEEEPAEEAADSEEAEAREETEEAAESEEAEEAEEADEADESEEPEEESWIDRMDALLAEDGGDLDEENEDGISLRQILESDETEPAEGDDELTAEEMSDETADILSQADELIAHEAPAPAVAPEPIEIPMPEPIVLEDEKPEEETTEEPPEETPDEEDEAIEDDYDDYDEDAPKPKGKKLMAWLIALLIVALAGFGSWYFYNNYYLQPIDSLTASGKGDTMTVSVSAKLDESKLTAVCVDLYGNKKTSPISGGTATFTGLTPGTQYSISLEVEGLHSLTGQTITQYYTLPQASVLGFSSTTGPEDGSVILSFTTEGPEVDGWTISYATEGEDAKTLNFTGNMITISGLTVGSEYTFTLSTSDDVELIGNTEYICVPSALVFAENLTVSGYQEGTLTAFWNAPEGVAVESWTARCYNDAGFDQVLTVTEPTATFTEIVADASYTIEITAANMTQSTRTYVTANPITVTAVNTQVMDDSIAVAWEYEGKEPEGGWLLLYTLQGGSEQHVIQCESPLATITPAVPGCHYDITIQAANTTSVFGGTGSADVPAAGVFGNYGLNASDITVTLCKAPDGAWSYGDISEAAMTSSFNVGDSIGVLLRTRKTYNIDYSTIVTLYVIRDAAGVPVCVGTTSATWEAMWAQGRCALEVPQAPTAAGDYILEIYFDGDLLTSQALTFA